VQLSSEISLIPALRLGDPYLFNVGIYRGVEILDELMRQRGLFLNREHLRLPLYFFKQWTHKCSDYSTSPTQKRLRQTFDRLSVGELDQMAVGIAEGGEVADGAAEVRGWVNEDS